MFGVENSQKKEKNKKAHHDILSGMKIFTDLSFGNQLVFKPADFYLVIPNFIPVTKSKKWAYHYTTVGASIKTLLYQK